MIPSNRLVITEELIGKFGDRLDKDYMSNYIQGEYIFGYEEVEISFKELRATVYDGEYWHFVPIDVTPAYKYLCGDKEAYLCNMKARENLEDNVHSVERYESLILDLEGKEPDDCNLIVVKSNNVIDDGQHRAAYFMKKMGRDSTIKVLRIYRIL